MAISHHSVERTAERSGTVIDSRELVERCANSVGKVYLGRIEGDVPIVSVSEVASYSATGDVRDAGVA